MAASLVCSSLLALPARADSGNDQDVQLTTAPPATTAASDVTPVVPSTSGAKVNDVQVRLSFHGGVVGAQTLAQLQQALDNVVRAAVLDQLGGDLGYIASR